MNQPFRLDHPGRLNRDQSLKFTFNGSEYEGLSGDTLASALIANGIRTVGRSFKYHRPRGFVTAGVEEPNGIFQIGEGARSAPNIRGTQLELYEGLIARSVNCWPNVDFDIGAINSAFARMLPAGFYYKTFMWPKSFWMHYEKVIRRAAGFGTVPTGPDPDHYDKMNAHCDVLVVGGGSTGLMAALAAANTGAKVILADEQQEFGGALLSSDAVLDGVGACQWVDAKVTELESLNNVTLLRRSTVVGYYDHNFVTINERRTDHIGRAASHDRSRERLWRVRAKQVVLATGAIERPLVFPNNDRPGVMLASAVSTYLRRYAVAPGRRAVVFTNNDSAYQTALDLLAFDIPVSAVVDSRANPEGDLVEQVREAGVSVETQSAVSDVLYKNTLSGAEIVRLNDAGDAVRAQAGSLGCDLIAVSGGWSPVVHLHAQSGGRPRFDDENACFVPGEPVQNERSAGACNGAFALSQCLEQGRSAGTGAAQAAGFDESASDAMAVPDPGRDSSVRIRPLWLVPTPKPGARGGKKFVDLQNDTTASDIQLAVREGFHSVEHVKRYTALGFGTDQGKLGNINGMAILADALGQSLSETGTTTFRPNYTPVTFGTVAGRDLGDTLFDPVRKTSMHEWHVAAGAMFENVGQWKRPWYYPAAGETMHDAVQRECRATREGVGLLDASTLGKIDIRGRDAVTLLNRVYTNAWDSLSVGRCRYGLMLGEDGMVMDDGVTSCLGEHHYLMTTTTGGAAHVLGWLEQWLQTEWPELEVYLTSVTDEWAVMSLAGPKSRDVLRRVCTDIDFDGDEFPFMSFREGTVAGVSARVFRISFSGELAYEVNVPANRGNAVWEALVSAGAEFGITPYGTETMHVLRAEKGYIIVGQDTDGSVTPGDLGMDWIVSKKKDFLGRRSLSRPDCVRPNRKQLVGLLTTDPAEVLPEGAQLVNEPSTDYPVPMVGHVTSSYFSAQLGRSIALALVKGGHSRDGGRIYAQLMDGRVIETTIANPVFFDPEGERQRV